MESTAIRRMVSTKISWSSFQHPSYAKAQDCNIVLESIFKHLNLDINLYHRDNGSVEPPKKKKKVASKQTVDNDDTVIEDEEEYLNSSQFSANESDDNEIEFANSNEDPVDPTSVFPPETEPCPYEIARNNNIAELGAALAQAQANGEF